MKRSATTQRITLFPFLAVLICTMGALLVLLVVISKRAQATADDAQENLNATAKKAVLDQQHALAEDSAKLHALHQQVTEHLSERRRSLAHIEDHMRRLGAQIRQLQASTSTNHDESGDSEKQIDKLRAELEKLEAAKKNLEGLIEEMKSAAPKKTSYRIVPYHGSNGTARRPIYLECRKDGVYFQPEGILLAEKDFARPLGPENPLAAGIRAQSSFLREHRSTSENEIDPYPLLIVRPSGIPAYYAARIAIRSWESEFGYELVDEDIELDFSVPDPTLARVTQEAIDIARPRHQFMVARAQRMQLQSGYGRSNPGGNGRGRMVGAGEGDDGNGFGGGLGKGQNARSPSTSFNEQLHGTDTDRNRSGLRRAEALRKAAAESKLGGRPYGEDGESSAFNEASLTSSPSSGQNPSSNEPNSSSSEQNSLSSGPSSASSESNSGTQNEKGPGGGSNSDEATDQASGISFQFGGAKPQPPQSPQSTEPPISDVRGDNWALPGISGGSFAFARPIRVEITKGDVTLFPTDSRQRPIRVSFESNTRHTIEQFVAAIWRYMETWGTAGRGMYWKPVLNIYTEKGAEPRAAELEHLLQRSGIEIKRK